MSADIPRTTWERSVSGGKTAARIGRKALAYLARRSFLAEEERLAAKQTVNKEIAEELFKGLSQLRGTALKAAQILSMELELLPPEITEELKKSYHQVPPLNRALVRKVMQNALGGPPEDFFLSFEPHAFAAASLGQVHRATAKDGAPLAVKIQYPGVRETIQSDMRMVRAALRAHPAWRMLAPVMEEIEARLMEETDYRRELKNMLFFRERLNMDRVSTPAVREDLSAGTVLAAERLPGKPLNDWLQTCPDREERDRVAQTLQDIFISGLYRLHCIHADPNPGNFLVMENGDIGLVDFGCVKYFDHEFVSLYGTLPGIARNGKKRDYLALLHSFSITKEDSSPKTRDRIFNLFFDTSKWLSRLWRDECFDFETNPGFIAEGNALMRQVYALRSHMGVNPNFILLHRTRYGLLRIFEQMGARVRFRNPYEE